MGTKREKYNIPIDSPFHKTLTSNMCFKTGGYVYSLDIVSTQPCCILSGFVPHIDQLFDEDVLIGSGWTARESLRPLAYSTLADLVHHVRSHLPLHHLSLAVHLFSKNVHDESLPVSIQTMSCKVSHKSLLSRVSLSLPLNEVFIYEC